MSRLMVSIVDDTSNITLVSCCPVALLIIFSWTIPATWMFQSKIFSKLFKRARGCRDVIQGNYRIFYPTHFLLILINCPMPLILLYFYCPTLIQTQVCACKDLKRQSVVTHSVQFVKTYLIQRFIIHFSFHTEGKHNTNEEKTTTDCSCEMRKICFWDRGALKQCESFQVFFSLQ